MAFKVTTVFDQEELLARERDQPMFTPAVRRDIYRVLRNPRNPAEGARTNDGPTMFESVLLAKSSNSDGSAAWDSFAFARRGGNPSGYTVLDDEQMLEAISSVGKVTPVALAVTQAFETYLSQMAENYWGEREAALLSVDFLVAFGNEMTQRLDVNNRIRSTRLTPQEIQVLSEQPFANFVDRESFEAFQGPGDDWQGEQPIPLAGNYGNSDLGMDSRNTYGSANQPSQQRQPPPPQQQPAPGYNDWGRSSNFNNNNYNTNSQPGGGVGVGGYRNGNGSSYAGGPDSQRGMRGPLPPGGSNDALRSNNNNNNNYNTNSQPGGGGVGGYGNGNGNSYAGGPDPQQGMGGPTSGGANDALRSNNNNYNPNSQPGGGGGVYGNSYGGGPDPQRGMGGPTSGGANNVLRSNNNNNNYNPNSQPGGSGGVYGNSYAGGPDPQRGMRSNSRMRSYDNNQGGNNVTSNNNSNGYGRSTYGGGRPNDGRSNDGRPNNNPNNNGQPPRRGGSRKDNAQWDSKDDSSKGWYDNF
jgi:hypothetical protein